MKILKEISLESFGMENLICTKFCLNRCQSKEIVKVQKDLGADVWQKNGESSLRKHTGTGVHPQGSKWTTIVMSDAVCCYVKIVCHFILPICLCQILGIIMLISFGYYICYHASFILHSIFFCVYKVQKPDSE
jgi:hypothetical protein